MRKAPGPSAPAFYRVLPKPFQDRIGAARLFLRDPLEFFVRCVREYGNIVALSPDRIFLLNHPDDIKHVLQDNHRNYCKGPTMTRMLKPFFGQGLITSEGEQWLRQRRLAQPAFNRRHSPEMLKLMVETTAAMLARWEATAGQSREHREELTQLTLQILLKGVLGTDWGKDPDALLHAVLELEGALSLASSFSTPVPLPLWIPTRRNRATRRALRTVDYWIYELIASRRRSGQQGNDLLALLMAARDTDGDQGMSDQQLRDELLTMLRTGHSTLREAISWAWYLLGTNPDVQQRLQSEIDQVLGGRMPVFEDVARLPYTWMVLHEAMRLYPPAWVFVRTAIGDDEIGGYHIPAQSMIVLCPYLTHRSAAWWEDPEKFDPERFSRERSAGRPPFAFFPFGGGPRLCIGNNFALMEATVILAMTAQKYHLVVDEDHPVRPVLYVSLMAHNLWLRMIERKAMSPATATMAADSRA